jgi:hypothetical protein
MTALNRTGMNRTGMNRTGMNRTGMNRTGMTGHRAGGAYGPRTSTTDLPR